MASQELCMPITTAAIGLVDALFSAAVGNAVLSDGFSAHLRLEVLWLASGYVLDIWIGFNEWKYLVTQRRFEIGMRLFSLANLRHDIVSFISKDSVASIHHRPNAYA